MSDISLVDTGQEDGIFDFNPGFSHSVALLETKSQISSGTVFWYALFHPGSERSHELVVPWPVVFTRISEKAAPDSWGKSTKSL